MIKRIVKLTFQPDKIEIFKTLFEETKLQIAAQKGCTHLELWQDTNQPNIFFTYSFWEKEEDLNNYRKSKFFGTVWPRTKALFAEKPEAWSVKVLPKLG